MLKWLKSHVGRHMIRPVIYKAFSRLAYSLTAALIWDRFFSRTPTGLATCFVLLAAVFALGSWIAHLRMDGYRFPRLPAKVLRRKKPDIFYGDMIDHVDEPVINFEDLDDDEQDVCLILADLAVSVIYLIASLLLP